MVKDKLSFKNAIYVREVKQLIVLSIKIYTQIQAFKMANKLYFYYINRDMNNMEMNIRIN